MNKESLIDRCNELGIKYQENDTKLQLELMISGFESIEKIKTLEAENAELLEIIKEMQSAVNESEEKSKQALSLTDKIILPTIEYKKKFYLVAYPKFRFNGKMYEAADLVDDMSVVEELIKLNSGVLKETKTN